MFSVNFSGLPTFACLARLDSLDLLVNSYTFHENRAGLRRFYSGLVWASLSFFVPLQPLYLVSWSAILIWAFGHDLGSNDRYLSSVLVVCKA
jgi:hypothetical protein